MPKPKNGYCELHAEPAPVEPEISEDDIYEEIDPETGLPVTDAENSVGDDVNAEDNSVIPDTGDTGIADSVTETETDVTYEEISSDLQ